MQEKQEKSQGAVEESANQENVQPDLQNGQEEQNAQEAQEPTIEDKLAEAEAKIAELTDSFLRARAEAENVRRRAQEDIAKAHKFAIENFASSMVAVKDSLETALKVENPTVESFKEGVDMTLKQLNSAFEKNRLVEVMPQKGDKMDPEKHQAISMVEADQEANTIVEVLQKGYMIADRLLRPAMVIVAASKNS